MRDHSPFEKIVRSEDESEREVLIQDLVSKMTLKEKVDQMSGDYGPRDLLIMAVRYGHKPFGSGRNDRLGIPAILFTDGPRGIAVNNSTCFPVSMARGATWDIHLEERVGSAMGVEARSQGANFSGGVCINVPRHPGWGRAQETFGDDPFHLGVMGEAMMAGLQRHVMACVKHYACNSIEESRFRVDVRVDERVLREIYLPHFKRCVKAGAAAVMSAYNKVNGRYCGHNRHLLREILKGDWGFDGLVMSDFIFGVRDAVDGANAGLDIEMPRAWRYGRRLIRAVRRGAVSEGVIDEAVTRIIRQKARFAAVGEPSEYSSDRVACREHTELALEVARKSMVLLKNEGGVLPLDRRSVSRLAVIGKLADRANTGDHGSSRVRPPYVVTPLEGIRKKAPDSLDVVFAAGGDTVEARRAAREADAVVLVVGLTHKDEGEALPFIKIGGDRENLDLRREDEELIKAVAGENDRCVVVLQGGSAVTMESWKDEVGAILMAWYPGMEGGNAIAEILFGETNPSGKLPIVFPRTADQLPHFDKKARTVGYEYYHGYRLFDKRGYEPGFSFGFGLSYVEFEYKELRLSDREIGMADRLEVFLEITNRGEVPGDEIVQAYVSCVESSIDRPVKELKGFARVSLEPGETKTVSIWIDAGDLAYYDAGIADWVVEETEYKLSVGSSSREEDLCLSESFRIYGSP